MCGPAVVPLVAMGMQVAAAAYTTAQARANADAQKKWGNQQYALNKEIADTAAIASYASLQRRQVEERTAAAQSITQVTNEARRAMGSARVAASEAGGAGLSVDELMASFHRQELNYASSTIRQQAFRDTQFQEQLKAVQANQQGRILDALPAPVQKPSWWGAAVGVSADLANTYANTTSYDKSSNRRVWRDSGQPVWGDG